MLKLWASIDWPSCGLPRGCSPRACSLKSRASFPSGMSHPRWLTVATFNRAAVYYGRAWGGPRQGRTTWQTRQTRLVSFRPADQG